MATFPLSTDREAFRAAVATVAARTHEKLPQCNGRIDSAVKLVLAGDVELLPDGGARVASRSDAATRYHTVNGHCTCKDFARAPEGLCSHRLAYGIARRAAELAPLEPPCEPFPDNDVEEPAAPAQAPAPLPEAPASVNVRVTIAGREVQWTLRDTSETRLAVRLEALLAQYPAPQVGQHAPLVADTPQCPQHGAMKASTKGKGWYCPNKNADDTWCQHKAK